MKNKKYITLNGIEWEVGKFKKANKEQLKGAKNIKVKSAFLKNTSLLILITYEGQELKVNDIVIFKVPDKNNSVVHRILGFKNDFIITKGDNNLNIDQWDTVKENITYVVGGIIYT